MKKIVSYFVQYPFFSWLFPAVIMLAGIMSFLSMKSSFFPERSERNISVSVVYPGASPKEMEESITVRIEQAIRGIVGIKEINSSSSENFTTVNITTTGDIDLDETLAEVKNAVDGITSMPVDAERPIVRKIRNKTRSMFTSLHGDVDLMTLKEFAYQIEDDFLASGIVTQVVMHGFPNTEISVEVSEANLMRYNLSFDEISRAIAKNNTDISAGQIKSDQEEMLIRARSRSVKPNSIADIIIRANPDGSFLRIRDVGSVKMQFEDVTSGSTLNGKPEIGIEVMKLANEDLKKISKYVHDYAESFNQRHPEVTFEITFDFLSMLQDRINMLIKNGLIGLLLVFLALGFFLSFRLSTFVAVGIPISFMAMFIIASMYGITINMISLFGMILVIGILVDDGIVIAENIYSQFESGKSPLRAAIDGTMEVLPAVFTSVSTTIVSFVPILLIKNGGMEFMFDMAIVVIFSLGFSLIEAFFILPAHLASPHILRSRKRSSFFHILRTKLNAIIAYMRDNLYGSLLKKIINWYWVGVFVPIALIIVTMGLIFGGFIQTTIFPAIQFDSFTVNFAFKPGTGEAKTREYLDKFENIIETMNDSLAKETGDKDPYIKYISASLGRAFNGSESGSHTGSLEVFFHNMEGRKLSSFQISAKARKMLGSYPELEKFTIGGHNRFGKPVSISLVGKDLEILRHAKEELISGLNKMSTIKNITDNNPVGKQEVLLKLKPKAFFLGLDQSSISMQIRQGFYGGQVQRLQKGKDEIRVWVRYPKSDRQTLGQLENIKIKTPKGEFPLTELADYEIKRGPVSIARYNAARQITIEADLVDPYASVPDILGHIHNTILAEVLNKHHSIRLIEQGQAKSGREAQEEMMPIFGAALFVILLIIIIHFKSVFQALIIIAMIPIAWIGAAWGHGLESFWPWSSTVVPISMLSAWGMVALAGVIINDAVVFLAKYNSLIKEGMKIKDAVYKAGVSRFRAIVLTTLTTTLGLYPLIFEGSFQAQFLKPMAISLAYGVTFGTGFILLFFPSLILVSSDIKYLFYRYIAWMQNKERPTKEECEPAIRLAKKAEIM